jgi:hypothetical protein
MRFLIYHGVEDQFLSVWLMAEVLVQAGLYLHQGYIREKCHANQTQNSHFQAVYFLGLGV